MFDIENYILNIDALDKIKHPKQISLIGWNGDRLFRVSLPQLFSIKTDAKEADIAQAISPSSRKIYTGGSKQAGHRWKYYSHEYGLVLQGVIYSNLFVNRVAEVKIPVTLSNSDYALSHALEIDNIDTAGDREELLATSHKIIVFDKQINAFSLLADLPLNMRIIYNLSLID